MDLWSICETVPRCLTIQLKRFVVGQQQWRAQIVDAVEEASSGSTDQGGGQPGLTRGRNSKENKEDEGEVFHAKKLAEFLELQPFRKANPPAKYVLRGARPGGLTTSPTTSPITSLARGVPRARSAALRRRGAPALVEQQRRESRAVSEQKLKSRSHRIKVRGEYRAVSLSECHIKLR